MKAVKLLFVVAIITFISGCEKDQVLPDMVMPEDSASYKSSSSEKSSSNKILYKATGSVEIEWKGAGKGGENGNKPEDLLTFFDFSAIQKADNAEAKGEMTYLVLGTDFSPHREIRAEVIGLYVDKVDKKAWILGRVTSDSKGCTGNGSGGHDSGCSDDHTDGGCTDDHTDGGCSDDDSSHDGGCSHEDTDSEGGCGDSGNGETDQGGNGGPGGNGSDKGNPLSGKNCRLGQLIAVKLHDRGTPGTNGDGINWKWFDPASESAPSIEGCNTSWTHLCKKTIIGGNLVVHK